MKQLSGFSPQTDASSGHQRNVGPLRDEGGQPLVLCDTVWLTGVVGFHPKRCGVAEKKGSYPQWETVSGWSWKDVPTHRRYKAGLLENRWGGLLLYSALENLQRSRWLMPSDLFRVCCGRQRHKSRGSLFHFFSPPFRSHLSVAQLIISCGQTWDKEGFIKTGPRSASIYLPLKFPACLFVIFPAEVSLIISCRLPGIRQNRLR